MERTDRHASFLNQRTGKVRHLLIDEVTGPAFTDLIMFAGGREETLFSGTEYESRQKADQFGQAWVKDEGFKWAKEDEFVYEPLEDAVKLAIRLGHDAIYDPRSVQMDPRKPNFSATGMTSLKDWPGMQAKNGGSYTYAVTLMHIIAAPQLPPGHPLPTSLSVPQQFIEVHKELEKVGPRAEFLFAGITVGG